MNIEINIGIGLRGIDVALARRGFLNGVSVPSTRFKVVGRGLRVFISRPDCVRLGGLIRAYSGQQDNNFVHLSVTNKP